MNESKAINALTNIFHIETYTGENGNYELSSNSWGLHFDVRIREYTIFIQDGKGARCSIDSDEDLDTMCQEIVAFIGEVIKDESKNYTFENRSQILAWPYNCNTHYVDYLKTAFDMNPEEDEFDYAKRKRGVTNSKKPVQSSLDESSFSNFRSDLYNAVSDMFFEKYRDADVDKAIAWVSEKFFEKPDTEDYEIESSMQGQERGIQAIMDEYGCTREEAIEIMNGEVTSGCHDKAKKKAKKEIKSSLKEEFDQALSDNSTEWPEDEYNVCLDNFKNEFAEDHNITYEEVDKMYNELQDEWYKGADNAGIVDIYSSVTRNHKNIQALYN